MSLLSIILFQLDLNNSKPIRTRTLSNDMSTVELYQSMKSCFTQLHWNMTYIQCNHTNRIAYTSIFLLQLIIKLGSMSSFRIIFNHIQIWYYCGTMPFLRLFSFAEEQSRNNLITDRNSNIIIYNESHATIYIMLCNINNIIRLLPIWLKGTKREIYQLQITVVKHSVKITLHTSNRGCNIGDAQTKKKFEERVI